MLLDRFDGGTFLLDQTRNAEEALRRPDGHHSQYPKGAPQGENQPVFSELDRASSFEDSQFSSHWTHASSANAPSETAIRQAFPTLDQLRDSKSFDELKARSASRSLKGSKIHPPSLPSPMAQKEGAEDDSYVDDLSSLPISQRILSTYDYITQSVAGNPFETQKLVRCEVARRRHVTRAEPTNFPDGFWPEDASRSMSQVDVDMADGSHPTDRRQQAGPPEGRDNAGDMTIIAGTTAADLRYQVNLTEVHSPRPVFTLEQQVSDEAIVKGQQDIHQNTPLGIRKITDRTMTAPSKTKSDQSGRVSYARARQKGGSSRSIGFSGCGSGGVATFERPLRYAAESMIASLDARSSKNRSLNLLNDTMQSPPRIVSELIPQANVMPRLPRAIVLQDVLRPEQLQKDHNCPVRAWSRSSWSGAGTDQRGDSDKEQMESVIPGSDEPKSAFELKPISPQWRPNAKVASLQKPLEAEEWMRFDDQACRPHTRQAVHDFNPAKSCHTPSLTRYYTDQTTSLHLNLG